MGRTPVSPHDFDEQRLAGLTDFRCEKCQNRYPFELLDEPTYQAIGRRVCTVNCAYTPPHNAKAIMHAEDTAALIQEQAESDAEAARRIGKARAWTLMDGVAAVESISSTAGTYPTAVPLTIGGAHKVVTVTGVNFSAADTIAYGSAGIVNHAAVSRTTTATTLTVKATAGPAGFYGLTFNDNNYPRLFRVME